MLLLSRVCAEFHDRTGDAVFTVTPRSRLTFVEAPESIREDPLFEMLLNDRSIEVTEEKSRRKQLENDPELPDESCRPEQPEKPSGASGTRKTAAEKKGKPDLKQHRPLHARCRGLYDHPVIIAS